MEDHKALEISAVIIAAGFSSRMHDFKPLLSIGDKTVLERTVSTFICAGITDIVVVLGHQAETLIPLIESLGIRWVINPNYEQGMYTSIQIGAKMIDGASQCFFMMPVDVPLVMPETIEKMTTMYEDTAMNVLYPSYEGRRGHPPLISTRLIPKLSESADSGGLKGFLEREGMASYLVVDDPGILMDMDTQADYEKLKALRHKV
jgi:CTP:molybdopterin cytidylyltransferase MocA